jgi:uncharacterized protein
MIHPYLQPYQTKLADLCRQYTVTRLYAFGSVTSSEFDEAQSDVDLLVELPADMAPEQKGEIYFRLLGAFESLFGRKVDLLLNRPFRNPYFARAVESSKELLYVA